MATTQTVTIERLFWNAFTAPLSRKANSATTDRGWLFLSDKRAEDGAICLGNYVHYPNDGVKYSDRPEGANYHACAYIPQFSLSGRSYINRGHKWCVSIEEAQVWIAQQVIGKEADVSY